MKRYNLLACVLLMASCEAGPVDHADPGPEGLSGSLETLQLAVSCDPKLLAYPVLGPHNGGWDNNALDFTCPPHPGSSPDNSDWIPSDHYGNDIFAEKGELAVAPVNGVVVKSGWNDVGGWRVTLEDACGWWYYSAHLDSIDPAAQLGAVFTAGQVIGVVGNSGSAKNTAPHIHFSIYPGGAYTSGVDPFPYLQAIDTHACDDPGEPVTPPEPPASKCPSGQTTAVCDGSYWLLSCVNGAQTGSQNCGDMGGYCTETLGTQAACVSTACTSSPSVPPTPGKSLCVGGVRHICGADGWPSPTPCPTGESCVGAGQCEGPETDPDCPPSGQATMCNGGTTFVSCGNGVKTGLGDCAVFGGICVELTAGDAACVDPRCAEPVSFALVEHAICVEGVRHVCGEDGWASAAPCAEGHLCEGPGDCVAQCAPGPELCNETDDDCDGKIDEDLPVILGSACPTTVPGCEVWGIWVCGPGGTTECWTDPALCMETPGMEPGARQPTGDRTGGVFTPAQDSSEPPEEVTSTCSGGPTPSVPVALLVLLLTAWARRRRTPIT